MEGGIHVEKVSGKKWKGKMTKLSFLFLQRRLRTAIREVKSASWPAPCVQMAVERQSSAGNGGGGGGNSPNSPAGSEGPRPLPAGRNSPSFLPTPDLFAGSCPGRRSVPFQQQSRTRCHTGHGG